MSKFIDKIKDIMGFSEDSEDIGYQEEEVVKKEENPPAPPEKEVTLEEPEPVRPVRRRPREHTNITPIRNMESSPKSNTNNVIGMPGVNTSASEVVVFEPHSFEEIPKVIETLRQRRSVVLNLNVMDPEDAQRAVDFVAGGTYAIDGHQERIGESIFLFTPNCVKVSNMVGLNKDNKDNATSGSTNGVPNTWTTESTRIARI